MRIIFVQFSSAYNTSIQTGSSVNTLYIYIYIYIYSSFEGWLERKTIPKLDAKTRSKNGSNIAYRPGVYV